MYTVPKDNTAEMAATLEILCKQPGISTHEHATGIVATVAALCGEYGAESVVIDDDGNVVATVGDGETILLLEAHLDEVGFEVTEVSSDGKARLSPCGVIKPAKIKGGSAYNVRTEAKGVLEVDELERVMFCPDVNTDQRVGDVVSFTRSFVIKDTVVRATALDNRLGCVVLLETMRRFRASPRKDVRVVFVFSPGEETDTTCIRAAVARYAPDLFIVVDAAYALPVDFETRIPEESIPKLSDGCAIQHKGHGFVVAPKRIHALEKIAKKQNVRIQRESVEGDRGKTNFSHFLSAGVDAGVVINIPVQDQHRAVSTTDLRDAIEAARLLCAIANDAGHIIEIRA